MFIDIYKYRIYTDIIFKSNEKIGGLPATTNDDFIAHALQLLILIKQLHKQNYFE